VVITVWLEDVGPGPRAVRSRMTWTPDVDSSRRTTASAASIEEVGAVVRGWLEAFAAPAATPPAAGTQGVTAG
jgi:hypothetical protein